MNKAHWIIDWETLYNCTVLCVEHYKEPIKISFVISRVRNDIVALYSYLERCIANKEWHIGYNSIVFDSQITQYILLQKEAFIKGDPELVANMIYLKAQEILERSNNGEWPEFSEKKLKIKNIDLYKVHHWDGAAKRSSLKWIEYSIDWFNIQEMPIHHAKMIETIDQVNEIVSYCFNDTGATKSIFGLSTEQLRLRKFLTEEYNVDLFNASEPRISREVFAILLSENLGIDKYELKSMRTYREYIPVEPLILPYIKFILPEFKETHEAFKKLIINAKNTKGVFKHTMHHKGSKTDFGLGGLHGTNRPGEYEAKDGMIIITSDVKSFYPNLIINNGWAPAHLPKEAFCDLYAWFYNERTKIPKKDPRNYVYKIILNAIYGQSNEENSFFYDTELMLRVTVNGQLSLMLLFEMLSIGIPGCTPIMLNTDGLEMMIPAHYREKYMEICKEWEKITSLELEHDEYQKMFIADVNSYMAVFKYREVSKEEYEKLKSKNPEHLFKEENGKYFYAGVKCKGRLEWEPQDAKDVSVLHKNKSALIVPKAVYQYFIHNKLPEEYLLQNRNILDYCIGAKVKGAWSFFSQSYNLTAVNGVGVPTKLQKVIRYYKSKLGVKIIKQNLIDGRTMLLEASNSSYETVLNVYQQNKFENYFVDEKYYLDRIYDEIENIRSLKDQKQPKLF